MATRDEVRDVLGLVDDVQAELVDDLRTSVLDPSSPSALPGWSRGHLLTHLARNADSVVRRLEASAAGVVISQYEGGAEGRAAEIEAGRRRSYDALVTDVEESGARVLAAAAQLDESAWSFETLSGSGQPQRALEVLGRRAREVTIHHTDLGIGFDPDRWPAVIVDELLLECLPRLEDRTRRAALAAWLIDRSAAPDLTSWG